MKAQSFTVFTELPTGRHSGREAPDPWCREKDATEPAFRRQKCPVTAIDWHFGLDRKSICAALNSDRGLGNPGGRVR